MKRVGAAASFVFALAGLLAPGTASAQSTHGEYYEGPYTSGYAYRGRRAIVHTITIGAKLIVSMNGEREKSAANANGVAMNDASMNAGKQIAGAIETIGGAKRTSASGDRCPCQHLTRRQMVSTTETLDSIPLVLLRYRATGKIDGYDRGGNSR